MVGNRVALRGGSIAHRPSGALHYKKKGHRQDDPSNSDICRRRDLNPHDRNDRQILSLLRIPVPPLRQNQSLKEAAPGLEPGITILQTVALATWPCRRRIKEPYRGTKIPYRSVTNMASRLTVSRVQGRLRLIVAQIKSPVHSHPLGSLDKKQDPTPGCRVLGSGKRDLNSRPQPWQGCALPLSYSRLRLNMNRTSKGTCQGGIVILSHVIPPESGPFPPVPHFFSGLPPCKDAHTILPIFSRKNPVA
jgi:hypothetical protein